MKIDNPRTKKVDAPNPTSMCEPHLAPIWDPDTELSRGVFRHDDTTQ